MIETFATNQIIFFLFIMALTAVVAGFFAGFFGIGGGIITVPCLFYIFGSTGIDKSFIMHLAVGTSFAIMIPTAIMSVYTHYKHTNVHANMQTYTQACTHQTNIQTHQQPSRQTNKTHTYHCELFPGTSGRTARAHRPRHGRSQRNSVVPWHASFLIFPQLKSNKLNWKSE